MTFQLVARSGWMSPGLSGFIGQRVRCPNRKPSAVICGATVWDDGSQELVTVPAAANTTVLAPWPQAGLSVNPLPTISEPAPRADAPTKRRLVKFIAWYLPILRNAERCFSSGGQRPRCFIGRKSSINFHDCQVT